MVVQSNGRGSADLIVVLETKTLVSSSFFESLGIGLGRQGFSLESQGLGLGFVKTKTKTMLTCVTFNLQRHQHLAIIFLVFSYMLFGKLRFTRLKHSLKYFQFFSGFVFP